ncbi:MAG: HEAT repeat domain-containing protein, partial [Mariniphaga sp.]
MMNKRVFQYTIILLLSLLTIGSFAQDKRTLDTKVADALAQMPANDLQHLEKIMAELTDLGQPGLQKMTEMLTAPGAGDDTSVRFALNSLARFASAFGREEMRSMLEAGLLQALNDHADTEVKTFLLNQLNLVGSKKSVLVIKEYLDADDLVEPVTQTLVEIGSPEAGRALYEALSGADAAAQITLVKALGELRCEEAVGTISSFAGSENDVLKNTAFIALANIGHPDSYKLLFKNAKKTNAEAVLIYANRLGERGEMRLCRKALNTILKNNQEDGNLHYQSAALSAYAKYFDYQALPLLLKAVDNGNKEFRYAVLNIAENIGGAAGTRTWIEKAGSAAPETKAEIIDMLGRRGDPAAVGFIKANLGSSAPAVREEAIAALVKLQGKEAVPVLISHLANGNDRDAAKKGLLQLLSQKHLAPVAEQLGQTSGAAKAAFIDLIAAKSGRAYFNEILAATGSPNAEERAAAFKALKNVSAGENLDALIKLLHDVNDEQETKQVQLAVTEAAGNLETEKTENGKVLQALKTSNKKERLITLLPEIGGDVALKTVTGYFADSEGELKSAAFEALAAWKDYSAAEALYNVVQTSTGEYRSKAFTSFVRQVRSANLPDDQKLLQYRKVMPYASGLNQQQMVINAIGTLKTFLSLVYLEQYLDNKELQQTAARSIMRIALADSNGENGFRGEKVRSMLKRVASVLKGEESDYDIISINNYLDSMPEEEGFVSMFNGRDLDGWQGLVGNPISRSKMSDQELAKKQEEANKKMHENWVVKDNTIVFNGSGDNLCSVKKYGDFELIADWRITKNGDSGIYLRGTPQVQIWDTARVDVGAQVGSGGLFNNQKHESKPLKVADNPVGEWNT